MCEVDGDLPVGEGKEVDLQAVVDEPVAVDQQHLGDGLELLAHDLAQPPRTGRAGAMGGGRAAGRSRRDLVVGRWQVKTCQRGKARFTPQARARALHQHYLHGKVRLGVLAAPGIAGVARVQVRVVRDAQQRRSHEARRRLLALGRRQLAARKAGEEKSAGEGGA